MSDHAGSPPPSHAGLPAIPLRQSDGHKGTFGTVGIVGGCARTETRMIGAAALAAAAALRSGAGLAVLVMPEPVLNSGLGIVPSATGRGLLVGIDGEILGHEAAAALDELSRRCDAIVIGPGMGRSDGVRAASVRSVQLEGVVAVVDADGLNALAETPEFGREIQGRVILTPHPGEFRRLCDAMGLRNHLGIGSDVRSRTTACEGMAQRLGAVVVLKGAQTVVSNGAQTWTHDFKDSVLATAGTGDVLAGIIGGLAAQFTRKPSPAEEAISMLPGHLAELMRTKAGVQQTTANSERSLSLFDTARLGVAVHSTAASIWRERHEMASAGLLAMELADCVPAAIERLRRSPSGG